MSATRKHGKPGIDFPIVDPKDWEPIGDTILRNKRVKHMTVFFMGPYAKRSRDAQLAALLAEANI